MKKRKITLDKIINNEISKIEINLEREKKVEINIYYNKREEKTRSQQTKNLEKITLNHKKEAISLFQETKKKEKKQYFWNNTFKKRKTRKERKNKAFQYNNILEQIVNMKNEGANYKKIQEKYTGFNNKENLTKAFTDYQNNYCNGKFNNKINKYDNKIATKEYKIKISQLYKQSNKNLKEIAQDLSKEYGMNISTSTISRYARKELNVKSRKEAKEKYT